MNVRVLVIGLRGFPEIQGGVETHAEQLYPRMKDYGCEIEVLVRSPYFAKERKREWRGIRFKRLWAPGGHIKGLESLVHTLLSVIYAGFRRADVVHIHAVGPALMTPLARLFRLNVVVTHHGPDYDREKWGGLARRVLKSGERLGMRFANERIVISKTIRDLIAEEYGRDSVLIPNGVTLPEIPATTDALKRFGLQRGKYFLQVSRLVPEKRQLDLIQAFRSAKTPGWKLVLVGGLEPVDGYVRRVRCAAKSDGGIVLTGFQTGIALRELYANAAAFILPSSHEGLPIVLLEALSYGLSVIASDIPANLELGLPRESYFPLGNVSELAEKLKAAAAAVCDEQTRRERRRWVRRRYDWQEIAGKTFQVYTRVLNGR